MLDIVKAYPEITDTIGIAGFLLYIISFCCVQTGRICGNGMLFVTANVAAASLVLISLINAFNIASFMIQVSFIAIGMYGICKKLRSRSRARPSAGAVVTFHPAESAGNVARRADQYRSSSAA